MLHDDVDERCRRGIGDVDLDAAGLAVDEVGEVGCETVEWSKGGVVESL